VLRQTPKEIKAQTIPSRRLSAYGRTQRLSAAPLAANAEVEPWQDSVVPHLN
jgi:hypothetical protein